MIPSLRSSATREKTNVGLRRSRAIASGQVAPDGRQERGEKARIAETKSQNGHCFHPSTEMFDGEPTELGDQTLTEGVVVTASKVHKYLFLTLCSSCLLMGNEAFAMAKASGDRRASNEAIASAYKSAIDQFVNELKLRENEGTKAAGTFMASFESYRSEVRKDDGGFCIAFSPKDFEGGPVFGGSISYCFDDTGTMLKRISKSR